MNRSNSSNLSIFDCSQINVDGQPRLYTAQLRLGLQLPIKATMKLVRRRTRPSHQIEARQQWKKFASGDAHDCG